MSRRDALVRAGITRFRPVILTAITTALGLVPLAIGLNFDFFGLYQSPPAGAVLGWGAGRVVGFDVHFRDLRDSVSDLPSP